MADLLVVEDDVTIGAALQAGLIANGRAVTWARSGAGALDAIAAGGFELALLDLGLPDMEGFDLCRRIRAAGCAC
jgi:DNA-binding response OmpR family regulator